MKRKILITVAIIISAILLWNLMYAIFVPDRPYGRDYERMFNFANSKWISEDGRVTLLVDDKWIMTGFVVNDDETFEVDIGYIGESYIIHEFVPDTEESVRRGREYEQWAVKRANADRTIVEVRHTDSSDVHTFEDRSIITFYRVDNTSQTE